jgi:hypothetical protein
VSEVNRTNSSLRDPYGFLSETADGTLLRHIDSNLADASLKFFKSDYYTSLVDRQFLVDHEDVSSSHPSESPELVLKPRKIGLTTYPHEWPFALLKSAALLTLDIQIEAIDNGFTLRDGTAFNVLFEGNSPTFIDFGSFDTRSEGQPWLGYKQFCEHFLAPLALASRLKRPPHLVGSREMDGIPLQAASSIMPNRSWLSWGLLWHLHLHGRSIGKNSGDLSSRPKTKSISDHSLKGLLISLRNTINLLKYPIDKGDWSAYYSDNSYSSNAMNHKEELVNTWLASQSKSDLLIDLGGNAGRFSAIAGNHAKTVLLVDSDHDSVELAAREFEKQNIENIHTCVIDLTDPPTGRGWAGNERPAFFSRVKPQKSLALALVHHLVIGAGIPLERVAAQFRYISPSLIVEWVPPEDPMVDLLSNNKSGQHHEYTQDRFERVFTEQFSLKMKQTLADSGRILYEFQPRN